MKRLRGRKRKRPNKEEFFRLYCDGAITVYELADHWQVTPHTIYQWSHQFNKELKEEEKEKNEK